MTNLERQRGGMNSVVPGETRRHGYECVVSNTQLDTDRYRIRVCGFGGEKEREGWLRCTDVEEHSC